MWLIKNNFQFGKLQVSIQIKCFILTINIILYIILHIIFLFCVHYKYVLNVSETPSLVNRTLPQGVKS